MKITKRFRLGRLVKDERGANMVEYIILVGIVALLAIVAFKYFNSSVKDKVNGQADTVADINDGTGEGG